MAVSASRQEPPRKEPLSKRGVAPKNRQAGGPGSERRPVHPFTRWQLIVQEIQLDVSRSLLASIRNALESGSKIAAKTFVAWTLSQSKSCRELVFSHWRSVGNPVSELTDIRRLVNHFFAGAHPFEKSGSGDIRLRIIATVQALDDMVRRGAWTVTEDLTVEEVERQIVEIGGMSFIATAWRRQVAAERHAMRNARREERARNLDTDAVSLEQKERRAREDHQRERNADMISKFRDRLDEMTDKEMEWAPGEEIMIVVRVRVAGDGRTELRRMRMPFQLRMINSVVNPTTPIK